MTKQEQIKKGLQFKALHSSKSLFILANAWDVVSARIFEIEGFKAIGTTSAGISSTLGYPDGEIMSLEENLEVIRRLARNIKIPLSADMESGYSTTIEGAAITAKLVIQSGAVGLNIEDSTKNKMKPLLDISEQVEKIKAIREAVDVEGIPFFINARTDVFLELNDEPNNLLHSTITRSNKFIEAGADGIFVPDMGNLTKDMIKILVEEIDGPLNILAGETTPSISELNEIGVARLSLGPRPMRALLFHLRKIAKELLNEGTYTNFTKETISYSAVNKMFENE